MADKKLSELVETTSASAADVFLIVQSGTSKKITKASLFSTLDVAGKCLAQKTHETLVAAGSVSTTLHTTFISVGVGSFTFTLAASEEGMTKTIACSGTAGTIAVTVLNGLGFGSVALTAVGSTITLRFVNGDWIIVGSHNVVIS